MNEKLPEKPESGPSKGGEPPEKAPSGLEKKKRFRISFGPTLLLVLAALLVAQLLSPEPEHPTWNGIHEWAEQERLREVVVTQRRVTGEFLDDEKEWRSFEFYRVSMDKEIEDLGAWKVEYTSDEESDGFWSIFYWLIPLGLLFVLWIFLMKRLNPSQQAMSFGKSRAKIYAEKEMGVTFADVAGIDEAVEEVGEIVDFLSEPEKYQALGARIPRGVLLLGAPGTGKTLLARAVAGEAKVPFFSLSGSDFVEMFVGVGASRVRDLFKQAAQQAPCIVFIDELDALGKSRGSSPVSNDEREQTLNALLVEMDGFDPNSGVIIISATNRPEILDPALIRPGRFDRQIVVDKPDIRGREAILGVHVRQVKLHRDVDLTVIAARTPGFAGADLANVINEAALLAARQGRDSVTMGELEEAIDRTIAGLERKKHLMTEGEKEIVAYHEAGHALVASMLPDCDPVHRISIIPRGMGSLGHTLQLPTDERYLLTVSELRSRMAVLLGGRAAESITFGQVSTGAQNDLERASKIARRMITEYGMSDRMGPVCYEHERRSLFINNGLGNHREYSEETAREIDEELLRIMGEAETLALETLTEHRGFLEKIAVRLSEVELIEREELDELLGTAPSPDEGLPEPPPLPSAEVEPDREVRE